MAGRTLYIGGLSHTTRSEELAQEFDRYGPLVRCDIPTPGGRSKGFAFIEFEDERDAQDAFNDMQGRRFRGRELSIQWCRNLPGSGWKRGGDRSPPRRQGSPPVKRRRPNSPRSPSPRRDRDFDRFRDRSPVRDRYRERSPDRRRYRDRSPDRGRYRDRSPERDRVNDRSTDRDRGRGRSPRRRPDPSPKRKSPSPHKKSPSPKPKSPSPKRNSPVETRRSPSPDNRRSPLSDREQSPEKVEEVSEYHSPVKSPLNRSHSRSPTPDGKEDEPRSRSPTPSE